MYNTDPDKLPSRPVISSLTTAQKEVESWVKENDIQHVTDGDGQSWNIAISILEKPSPTDNKRAIWQLEFKFNLVLDAQSCVKFGILNVDHDERLICLIGEELITVNMRPISKTAKSLDEARLTFIDMTNEMRKSIQGKSLLEVKRKLIAQWVDQNRLFGFSQPRA